MKILSIETSCDETAVAIIEATGDLNAPNFKVLSNLVLSQIKIHEKYGGVFPNLAKREHSKNLGPLIQEALKEAGLLLVRSKHTSLEPAALEKLQADLQREPELFASLAELFETFEVPKLDLIAVTYGPGLEPALWVGINGAKALAEFWNVPLLPVNHMEGHISSVLLGQNPSAVSTAVEFPALALLISGGHTELVLVPDWLSYKIIGETRDDAVGEAFDKVARMIGLPYPGGPQISQLANEARLDSQNSAKTQDKKFHFPRPMLHSGDFDFSFSGLKTSVLYTLRDLGLTNPEQISQETKKAIALELEDAIIDTLIQKTRKAIEGTGIKTLIVAGGVISNTTLRTAFQKLVTEFPGTKLLVPTTGLATDNALMIAIAAYVRSVHNAKNPHVLERVLPENIRAEGNVRLS